MFYNTFGSIIYSIAILYLIYYAVKTLIMRKKIIKKYNKGQIEEIVKK